MKVRTGLASLAAALLALGAAAWAADNVPPVTQPNSSNRLAPISATAQNVPPATQPGGPNSRLLQPVMADSAAVTPTGPDTLLDAGLDKIGLYKPMNDLGINITGFVEMGYFYDLTVPKQVDYVHRVPGDGILFPGAYKNAIMLDSVALNIERDVQLANLQKGNWDFGFRVEGIYGRDAFYTHSNGLLDNNSFVNGDDGPDNELDLENANFTVGIPLGNGLTIEGGKFNTPFGYETIDAPKNPLYTHSYITAWGEPATQTGILANYYLTADGNLSVFGGVTRGWNQSTNDDNGCPDFLGGAVWKASDKLEADFNLSVGAQYPHDCSHYMTVPELILKYKVSDQLTLGGDFLYGYQDKSAITPVVGNYFGVAGYAGYQICKYATLNVRAEWFEDGHSYNVYDTVASEVGIGGTLRTIDYYEVTVGVAITPLPDTQYLKTLTIRPEIRSDWASHQVFDGTKGNEVTAAIDAYITF